MKTCITCGILKDDSDFKNGNKCSACIAEYKHNHYLANKELYKSRARKNYADNIDKNRKRNKEYREKNKEKLREASRNYYLSDVGRENNRNRSAKYRATQDGWFKDNACSLLAYAIKTGSIIRPEVCSICRCNCEPEGHHKDYSKPLDVQWLCKKCHEDKHHLNEGQ